MADQCDLCLLGLIILSSLLTGASGVDEVFISSDENVCLPCNNALSDCKLPTWIYNSFRHSEIVDLIDRGIKNKDTERHERLSLGSDCSLNIKNVTEEDPGLYSCRQYVNGEQQEPDAYVYLHVLHVSVSPSSSSSSSSSSSQISPGRSVTLSCRLYSYDFPCDDWVRSEGLQLLWVNQAGVDLKTDSRYQILLFSSDHCIITLTTTLLNEDDNREWRCQLTLRNQLQTSVRYTVKYSASETEVSVIAGSLFRVIVIIVEMAVFAAPTVILLQIICEEELGGRTRSTQRK
ncbi:CXADR-like membrane protein isoform X3 [Megalobrama amblycephala]|uniref:CXADR-like membrane protein isoform X3 n=1 Tax=Megalobrama amblycephala TaxID=75352 RepID=UPI0020143A39|nr:CXADR-like membrane protein isoform X3 [Megalobrama amblycephala]